MAQTATEFLESVEAKEKCPIGKQDKIFKWRNNETLTDTSSSPLRQLSGRLLRLHLRSVAGVHAVGCTLGLRRELYGALRRPGQGVACGEGVVRWLVLSHHLWSARGSVQR